MFILTIQCNTWLGTLIVYTMVMMMVDVRDSTFHGRHVMMFGTKHSI